MLKVRYVTQMYFVLISKDLFRKMGKCSIAPSRYRLQIKKILLGTKAMENFKYLYRTRMFAVS